MSTPKKPAKKKSRMSIQFPAAYAHLTGEYTVTSLESPESLGIIAEPLKIKIKNPDHIVGDIIFCKKKIKNPNR